MIEALWSVEFISTSGTFGAGVVVFESERVFGGDAQYYYVGSYKIENGNLKGRITVTHYSGEPYSVFGVKDKFDLNLTGEINVPVMEIYGSLIEEPAQKIHIRMTKRSDLP